MKKILSLILTAVLMLTLAACGTTQNDEQSSSTNTKTPESTASTANGTETNPDNTAETGSEQTISGDGKILVVYFSWSGNLDKMAHWVADETGGDLIRVTAKEAYPENYNDTADRAKNEVDNGIRPEINVDLTPEQMAQYETVFFGFPVWWYDLPMSMWTFLESYDFSGKTVIPFFSHEGSSNGAGALPRVTELAKGANVRTDDALSIRGGSVASSESAVRDWVKGLNYTPQQVTQNTETSSENENQIQTDLDEENNENAEEMIVRITVGEHSFTAELYDNEATRALWEMLPQTFPMMNLYGREMCYRMGNGALPDGTAKDIGYEIGDISYWPPAGSLVILYKQNGEIFEQVKIGHTNEDISFFDGMENTEIIFEKAE